MKRYPAAMLVVSLLLCAASSAGAQTFLDDTMWSVDGGLSLPVGDAADGANLGFCIGFNGFYKYNDFLLIGARIGYNRWGANEEQWERGGFAADADGHMSSFEATALARYLILPDEMRLINFFAQAGIGAYRMSTNVDINYTSDVIGDISLDDSDFDLGICIGGGITLERGGLTYEIRPMYHRVFTQGDAFTYFSDSRHRS